MITSRRLLLIAACIAFALPTRVQHQMFSQTGQTCSTTVDRLKNAAVVNLDSVLSSPDMFTDPDFPHDGEAIYWKGT